MQVGKQSGYGRHMPVGSSQAPAPWNDGPEPSCSGSSILLMDEDAAFCTFVTEQFGFEKLKSFAAQTLVDGLSILAAHWVDVVLISQELWKRQEHEVFDKIRAHNDRIQIVVLARQPSIECAVGSMRAGALDYLAGPLEIERLMLTVRKALKLTQYDKLRCLEAYHRNRELRQSVLVGASGLASVQKLIELASTESAPVLITGETGTGKNLVAKAIHDAGPKRNQPFVGINCAALPDNLIETELFGHTKGAFTGADTQRRGIFEMAQGGTLFLDEIGDMPVHLQTKLLGVLEDKKLRRIGGEAFVRVDVRVVAATGTDLTQTLGRSFRSDLFYRLSVIPIQIPPLRARRQDIPELCEFLLSQVIHNRGGVVIDEHEIERMQAYDWPGNVRELKNVLERAAILGKNKPTRPSGLLYEHSSAQLPTWAPGLSFGSAQPAGAGLLSLEEVEKQYMIHVLGKCGNNYTKTAKALGIALSTLKRKLRAHGLR